MVGRLFQIIYLLMERDTVTAKELADKLEVSVRTINRDIEKLSEARIPVYTTKGRGGGIALLPDFVLNKKVLTEEEKSSILASMKLMGTVAYEDEQRALRQLEDFFGHVADDWIEIELDSWGEGVFDKEKFQILKDAILRRRKVSFEYFTRGERQNRTVRPYKLVFRAQSWYVLAYCELRNDYRYFKFHRMADIIELDEHFDVLAPPEQKEHYLYKNEPAFDVLLHVKKEMAYRIFDELPPEAITEKEEYFEVSIKNARESWFYQYLLSLEANVEVVSPQNIRDEVKRRVEMMNRIYNS